MKPVIDVQNLSKHYTLTPDGTQGSLKTAFMNLLPFGPKHVGEGRKDFWALKDVSFTVQPGEILGVTGKNGSGKSTLLKILSRITAPTEGRAIIRGRLQSLLEVGTGFHPDLTGRENVYLSCAIYGMNNDETNAIFEDIITFSGIGDFIDIPVKYYSSGMGVRLAFSISAFVQADIIFLDEIWAVGDLEFQEKSMKKMHELISSGATVLTVSHEPSIIKKFCTRTILLDKGRLIS
jgi:lipopolysaccharide transport system ATP-binding protein